MMRTVIAREGQYYKSNNEGKIKEAPVNKEDKKSDDESSSSMDEVKSSSEDSTRQKFKIEIGP